MITRRAALFVVVITEAITVTGAAREAYRAPRTADAQPDLEGVWNYNTAVPLQRPPAVGDRKTFTPEEFERQRSLVRNGLQAIARLAPVEAAGVEWFENPLYLDDHRTSLITYPVNGRLPATLDGVRRQPRPEDIIGLLADTKAGPPPALGALLAAFSGGKKDSYTDFGLSERCLFAPDVPMLPKFDDNHVQIVQGPDHVAIINDFERRLIALDGRATPADTMRSWGGTSRGHWEGDTLVVETRNFNGRDPSFAGVGTSTDKVVTERFSRTAANTLDYTATVVDRKTFTDRVEIAFPMARVTAQIYEGACHEGNYSLRYALSAARAAETSR